MALLRCWGLGLDLDLEGGGEVGAEDDDVVGHCCVCEIEVGGKLIDGGRASGMIESGSNF